MHEAAAAKVCRAAAEQRRREDESFIGIELISTSQSVSQSGFVCPLEGIRFPNESIMVVTISPMAEDSWGCGYQDRYHFILRSDHFKHLDQ